MEIYEKKRSMVSKIIIVFLMIIFFIGGYYVAIEYPFINIKDEEPIVEIIETAQPIDNIEEEKFDSEVKSNDATDQYFEDAIFIGDSRMEGLVTNANIENLNAITSIGMTVESAVEEPFIRDGDNKITVIQKLEKKDFSKLYIMLGTNELGWAYPEIFIEKYANLLNEVKRVNPDCVIYVLSVMPVNEKLVKNPEYKNNVHISEINILLKEMCDENQVYYLNIYDVVYDSELGLNLIASSDGLHLGPTYCNKVFDYLKDHYVEVE